MSLCSTGSRNRISGGCAPIREKQPPDLRRHPLPCQRLQALQASRSGREARGLGRAGSPRRFSLSEAYDLLRAAWATGRHSRSSWPKSVDVRGSCPGEPDLLLESGQRPLQNAANLNPLEALLEKLESDRRTAAIEVIRDVVAGLPESDQLLFRLVYGSDLSAAAAARSLGLEAPAARRALKGILTKCREKCLARGVRES